jgi:alkylation response protein AidB-like acyl-CoA dehydrogenase|tara:strand:- start:541 stop:1671 length:1131 start_codon:yes stop_codon:yes gene_type:complete
MDLGLSEDQEMLRAMAREFIEAEAPRTFVRDMEEDEQGITTDLWQKIAQVGWLGLIIPEEYGGTGQNLVDLGILMEEVGHGVLPGPFFNTALVTVGIMDAGSAEQKSEYLPKIANGDVIAAHAILEPYSRLDAGGINLTATKNGSDYTLNGSKLFVENAHISDLLLVPVRTKTGGNAEDGITLLLVDAKSAGITVDKLKTIATDNQCEVTFKDVKVPASNVLGKENDGWSTLKLLLQKGAALRCMQMVGALQEVLDMTVEYVKNRVQFGRPIGSFQAIQHYCANMATDVDGSRFITYQGLWRLGEDLGSDLEVSAAKAWVSDSAQRVAATAHQCHGAIGFTQEHDLQLFTRRLKAWEVSFGDGDYHRERVAQAMNI